MTYTGSLGEERFRTSRPIYIDKKFVVINIQRENNETFSTGSLYISWLTQIYLFLFTSLLKCRNRQYLRTVLPQTYSILHVDSTTNEFTYSLGVFNVHVSIYSNDLYLSLGENSC